MLKLSKFHMTQNNQAIITIYQSFLATYLELLTVQKCQMNYIIPEYHLPLIDNHSNKGALLTVSLLFDYVTNYANGCIIASFHANNCVSQNKNNLIMQLMTYFLITGKLKEISINFMIPGHTKFMPDGFFGLVKKHIRKYRCDSWKQVPQLIVFINKWKKE